MRTEPWTSATTGLLELEMDDELFEEQLTMAGLFSAIDARPEDIEPWQRLGDLLGHLTGEAETD